MVGAAKKLMFFYPSCFWVIECGCGISLIYLNLETVLILLDRIRFVVVYLCSTLFLWHYVMPPWTVEFENTVMSFASQWWHDMMNWSRWNLAQRVCHRSTLLVLDLALSGERGWLQELLPKFKCGQIRSFSHCVCQRYILINLKFGMKENTTFACQIWHWVRVWEAQNIQNLVKFTVSCLAGVTHYTNYCFKKTSQFKTVCKDDSGYITQLKQQKSKKVIVLVSTLTMWRCAAK